MQIEELIQKLLEDRSWLDNGITQTEHDIAEHINMAIKALEQQPETEQFAKWVATEIFEDDWEYNQMFFTELACRKLAKLGIVIRMGDEWELVEPQESEDKE